MTRLHVWLTLYGNKIEDGLWQINSYSRVTRLLEIWSGPYIIKGNRYTIDIDYNGELNGNVQSIRNELEIIGVDYKGLIKRWMGRVKDHEFVLVNF